jgi:hypothetical protein
MRHLIFLFLTALVFCSSTVFGQSKFQEKTKKDGVSIYYKWSHQNPIDKASPLQMVIKTVNENDQAINVSFLILYYIDGVLKEKNEVENFCIKAGKTANGRFNGLVFSTANISNAQIESDNFEWELSDVKIEKLDACPE